MEGMPRRAAREREAQVRAMSQAVIWVAVLRVRCTAARISFGLASLPRAHRDGEGNTVHHPCGDCRRLRPGKVRVTAYLFRMRGISTRCWPMNQDWSSLGRRTSETARSLVPLSPASSEASAIFLQLPFISPQRLGCEMGVEVLVRCPGFRGGYCLTDVSGAFIDLPTMKLWEAAQDGDWVRRRGGTAEALPSGGAILCGTTVIANAWRCCRSSAGFCRRRVP